MALEIFLIKKLLGAQSGTPFLYYSSEQSQGIEPILGLMISSQ